MIRHSKLDVSYLENLRNVVGPNKYQEINGVQVKMTSQRYKVFQKSLTCVECGVVGSFLAIEKHLEETQRYHINMYAINEDGEEVLMTKDHIIPKSKGGGNVISNYQTMCTKCNSDKGNGDTKTLRQQFDEYVYSKTKNDINKVDKLCIQLDIEPSDFWYFYIQSKAEFSELEFLTNTLTYFYYFLDTKVDKLFSNFNIEMDYFFFYNESDEVSLGDSSEGLLEFEEKIINASFKVRRQLFKNKIFSHLMKMTKTNIFNPKETRAIKLESINKEK